MKSEYGIFYDETLILERVRCNFKILLNRLGVTQKKLGTLIDVSESSMSDFCKGKNIPSIRVLLRLKELYKIDIDDFLTGDISMSILDTTEDEATVKKSRRYLGSYYVYYFDSGENSGADHLSAAQSMKYGLIYIYELRNAVTASKFRCSAGFDFDSIEEVKKFSDMLAAQIGDVDIEDMMINDEYGTGANKRAYTGEFSLGKNHVFIDLRHQSTDKAMMVFNQCREGESFEGAIAATTLVSIGNVECPVVQYMGLSKEPICLSAEEIQECLMMNCTEIVCGDEVDTLVELFKDLFSKNNMTLAALNDRQVKMLMKAGIQDVVNELTKNNLRRYSKVDFSDDRKWLSFMKMARERFDSIKLIGLM